MHTLINILKTDSAGVTYKNWSILRLPREDGISPVKLLFDKSKLPKLARFPSSLGISPVMPFPGSALHDEWNRYTLGWHIAYTYCLHIFQWMENMITQELPTKISNRQEFKHPCCQLKATSINIFSTKRYHWQSPSMLGSLMKCSRGYHCVFLIFPYSQVSSKKGSNVQ